MRGPPLRGAAADLFTYLKLLVCEKIGHKFELEYQGRYNWIVCSRCGAWEEVKRED